MKIPLLLLLVSLFSVLASAQSSAQGTGAVQEQPPIAIIDFYGLRSLSAQQAKSALGISVGDQLPPSKKEAQRRLEALPNVQQVRMNAVCCEAGKLIVYVGIKEKGTPTLQFRPPPKGRIRLSDDIVEVGEDFENALRRAAQMGDAGEDDSQGHALYSHRELRPIQEHFLTLASRNLSMFRNVLRHSSNAGHRALAAQIIAYAVNKRAIVRDLVYGMGDADESVRNNSMRALEVLAVFAKQVPKQRIKIPVRSFVKMLNSIEWTDRNKSSLALCRLTETRDRALLLSLRRHALLSLVEMAREVCRPCDAFIHIVRTYRQFLGR